MMVKHIFLLVLTFSFFLCYSCKQVNVYEKRVTVPHYKWDKSFAPEFTFSNNISHKENYVFAIIRHTNNYPYNNIWVKLTITNEKDSTISKDINIPLSKNNQNTEWANTGMNDIYEIKYALKPFAGDIGKYKFKLEQIMRENPLPEILNVGIRIERNTN